MSKEELVISGFVEAYPGWEPPRRIVGGLSVVDFFSMYCLSEVTAILLRDSSGSSCPIFDGIDEVLERQSVMSDLFKQKGLYSRDGGDLFRDYKIMRGIAYLQIGESQGLTNSLALRAGRSSLFSRFNLNMTSKEALAVARKFVDTWVWFD